MELKSKNKTKESETWSSPLPVNVFLPDYSAWLALQSLQTPCYYSLPSLEAALVNKRKYSVIPRLVQFIFSQKTSSIGSNTALPLQWLGLICFLVFQN